MRAALAIVTVTATAPAAAIAEPTALAPQAHADLGLSIVGVGYERPVTGHVAVQAQGGIFGTYFLPWFDRGDDVQGLEVGARVTWFARTSGRGLYVAPYLRGVAVRGERDVQGGRYGRELFPGHTPGREAALVGDDDHRYAGGVQAGDRLARSRQQHHALGRGDIAALLADVDRPVPVEEDDVVGRQRPRRPDHGRLTAQRAQTWSTASHQAWVHIRCTSWMRGV